MFEFVFFLIFIFVFFEQVSREIYWPAVFIVIIFAAVRTYGGSDYLIYERYFNSIDYPIFQYGYLYYSFNSIINHLGLSFNVFIFLTSCIAVFMQGAFFKFESERPTLALFVFFCTSYLWLDHILIRQSLASGFFLFGMLALKLRKNTLAISMFLVASFFHSSVLIAAALVCFFLYAPGYLRFGCLGFVFLSFVFPDLMYSLVILLNDATIKNVNIVNYLDTVTEGVSSAQFFEVAFAILALHKLKRSMLRDEYLFYRAIFESALLCVMLSVLLPVMSRFVQYYMFFYIVIVLRAIFSAEIRVRLFLVVLLLAYCAIRFFIFINVFDGGLHYSNYLEIQ